MAPKKRKPAKPARKVPTKKKTPKRARTAPASRVSRSDDEEFYIPASLLAGQAKAPEPEAENDDEEIFIPAGFGEGPPEWEYAGEPVDLMHLAQMHWTDGPAHARERSERVEFSPEYDARGNCKYGCGGFASSVVSGIGMHHYTCAYWNNEGKDKTPF